MKIARDGDLSRSFRRFEFGDFQVCTLQIYPPCPPSIVFIIFFVSLIESFEFSPPVDRVSRSLQLPLMMTLLLLMAVFCHLGIITYQMQKSVKFPTLWGLACIHFTGLLKRELLLKRLLAHGNWPFLSILSCALFSTFTLCLTRIFL